MGTVNVVAVLAAALTSFMIGGIWYNLLFVRTWLQETGLKEKDLQKNSKSVFLISFLFSLVMSINLAFFIGSNDWQFGLFAGFATGFGWIAMALGINYAFERKSWRLFAINAGYNIVALSVMGLLIGILQ